MHALRAWLASTLGLIRRAPHFLHREETRQSRRGSQVARHKMVGVDIGDPEIVVWGSPIELGKQDHINTWRDKLMRTQLLPAFEMSTAKLDDFINTIREVKPRMLFGYPSALTHIARHARKRGVRMNDLGIKVAFVTSRTFV